jgi:hypothetical protein
MPVPVICDMNPHLPSRMENPCVGVIADWKQRIDFSCLGHSDDQRYRK